MRSQINLICAAADPRSRRSRREQNGGSARLFEVCHLDLVGLGRGTRGVTGRRNGHG